MATAKRAVVDGLPTVPKEKFSKLEAYVKKVYGQLGTIRSVRAAGFSLLV